MVSQGQETTTLDNIGIQTHLVGSAFKDNERIVVLLGISDEITKSRVIFLLNAYWKFRVYPNKMSFIRNVVETKINLVGVLT